MILCDMNIQKQLSTFVDFHGLLILLIPEVQGQNLESVTSSLVEVYSSSSSIDRLALARIYSAVYSCELPNLFTEAAPISERI